MSRNKTSLNIQIWDHDYKKNIQSILSETNEPEQVDSLWNLLDMGSHYKYGGSICSRDRWFDDRLRYETQSSWKSKLSAFWVVLWSPTVAFFFPALHESFLKSQTLWSFASSSQLPDSMSWSFSTLSPTALKRSAGRLTWRCRVEMSFDIHPSLIDWFIHSMYLIQPSQITLTKE